MTRASLIGSLALCATLSVPAAAQVSKETLESLSASDKVETRIGTLEYSDGVPSGDTAQSVYDTIDFTRALDVYNNSFRGASALALKKGFESIGAGSGDIPPPNPTPTAPRRSTSVRDSPKVSRGATGSRRCPARAGSWRSASTARSSRSSTRAGA